MIDRYDMTEFKWNILFELLAGPQYGLGLKRDLEDYYGQEVNHGRLYPNLDDLVTAGLVEKSELDKRTNEYALTEAGIDYVQDRIDFIGDRLDQNQELQAAKRLGVEAGSGDD